MVSVHRNMASNGEGVTVWFQRELSLPAKRRGCHYISEEILKACKDELSKIKIGTAHIHIKHTSASLILNENYDPTVLTDMEMVLNRIAPQDWKYQHSLEGPDDMPAHAKAALMGSSVTVPITNGQFNLGTWQGVWLCEHRDSGGSRKLVVTMNGLKK
uniref:Secondary thiamine-phosphate synthase enzyme n=1 Tax=Biomphalaria glabrata TaxID=6526 RepID=A0A2C9LID6_BIOGL